MARNFEQGRRRTSSGNDGDELFFLKIIAAALSPRCARWLNKSSTTSFSFLFSFFHALRDTENSFSRRRSVSSFPSSSPASSSSSSSSPVSFLLEEGFSFFHSQHLPSYQLQSCRKIESLISRQCSMTERNGEGEEEEKGFFLQTFLSLSLSLVSFRIDARAALSRSAQAALNFLSSSLLNFLDSITLYRAFY